jgi:meso-butanediol dehydrogenase/(S,S)-butanediol dehydrogenase/diacetyl reductase
MLTPTRAHVFPTAEAVQERVNLMPLGRALGRLQVPEDVVPAIIFMASDGARFITGATLVVDGGFSIEKA